MASQQNPDASHKTPGLVNSVKKALQILECFTENQRELTLSQISSQLQMPKSTVLNLIRTLEANGYLLHTANAQTYQLSYKMMTLSYNIRASMPIAQIATPLLEELQVKTGENIYLTSHLDGQVFYLDGAYPSIRMANYSVSGRRLPMHSTGCGKAMLAYLPEAELEQVIEHWGLPMVTQNTITDRETLDKELALIRQRGYAIDNEEATLGIKCVAVSVRSPDGYPAGALSISGTTMSIRDELVEEYAKMLSRVSSILIGHASWFPAMQVRP